MTNGAATLGRLALLADGRRPPGVYALRRPAALPGTLAAALRARGLAAWTLDTTGLTTKADVLDRGAHALALPAWFGRNWDALVDALRDLPIPASGGVVLWVGSTAVDPDVRATALDVFATRALDPPPLSLVVLGGEDEPTPL